MFDSVAGAGRVLRERGFAAREIEALVGALVPAFVFEPVPGEAPIGGTRFGGTPDLPPGTAWPRPPALEDPEAIAGRGNADAAAHMRAHMARGLPYTFLAQVDLAEAASADLPASGLPRAGRLLFFYDLAVGPWETGTRPARVLWDGAARDTLVRTPMPTDLGEAAARERAEVAALRARYGGSRAPAVEEGTTYGAPARAMRLRPTLRFDDRAVGGDVLPGLAALYGGGRAGERFGRFRDLYLSLLPNTLVKRNGGHRQQLLGRPDPEQDDPLYDAVVVSDFGVQGIDGDTWTQNAERIKERARAWRLLLQVDLGDWMQADLVEGTVYFAIRTSDLAERRFEATVAVYQQT